MRWVPFSEVPAAESRDSRPYSAHFVGGVFDRLGRYAAETGGTFRADLKRVLTDEDGRVIGIHHNVAERDGKRLDLYCCVVFVLVGGRIVDGREHFYDLRAWDEFWS